MDDFPTPMVDFRTRWSVSQPDGRFPTPMAEFPTPMANSRKTRRRHRQVCTEILRRMVQSRNSQLLRVLLSLQFLCLCLGDNFQCQKTHIKKMSHPRMEKNMCHRMYQKQHIRMYNKQKTCMNHVLVCWTCYDAIASNRMDWRWLCAMGGTPSIVFFFGAWISCIVRGNCCFS